jgi:hypothetical protein
VVGVLLVNMWGRIDKARALIESKDQPSAKNIKGYFS